MTQYLQKYKKHFAQTQKGQILVIVLLAIVGLIAIIGLALDVGIIFINYGRLRRAVDSAALAAALQYREGYSTDDLNRAAVEFLVLNGINGATATVTTCSDEPGLCPAPPANPRKLVHVIAGGDVHLSFLPVIGVDTVHLDAQAVSEAASVDVVLVIDTSESMTWDAPAGDPLRDPNFCNAAPNDADGFPDLVPGECHPFEEVKSAAVSFVQQLYFPYDRVAIVTFDKNAILQLALSNDEATIVSTLENLLVFEAEGVCPAGNPCRRYTGPTFEIFDCPYYYLGGDPTPCSSTNIGGGLLLAGNEFANGERPEALWVTILLTDGVANAPYCPMVDWVVPFCRDGSAASRHPDTDTLNYDADDYAHDMADFVGIDQQSLIFSIGLGAQVTKLDASGEPAGQRFLEYAAMDGVGNGLYYFAPSGHELRSVFQKIADNIATRLTR
jgi:hypothetical protein